MTHALVLAAIVMIRTYNYAQLPADELARARDTAARTFAKAGITLQWVDCWVPQTPIGGAASCTEPLREGSEFVLRLMPSSERRIRNASRGIALGSSLIDHDARSGALMSVDPTLVSALAHTAGTDFATLLGRAIAHEAGHLLLGHVRHSRNGLMRALWSQDELRGVRPADWSFTRAEAAEMRQGLAARADSRLSTPDF